MARRGDPLADHVGIGVDDDGHAPRIRADLRDEGRGVTGRAPDRDRSPRGGEAVDLPAQVRERVAARAPEGLRGARVLHLRLSAAEPHERVEHVLLVAVADPLLDDAAPREHAHQRGRREVRHVLGREVERARGLERAVEARHLERDDGLDVRARGGERQLLEEAERVRQVLHHVPGDDEVGRDLRQRARRDEALAPQLHLRVRRLGDAMRIEADVPAGRPRLGERCKEFGVAVADLDDDRARGQARERLVTERAHVLAPSRRAAERAARLPGVLTGGRDPRRDGRRPGRPPPAPDPPSRGDASCLGRSECCVQTGDQSRI